MQHTCQCCILRAVPEKSPHLGNATLKCTVSPRLRREKRCFSPGVAVRACYMCCLQTIAFTRIAAMITMIDVLHAKTNLDFFQYTRASFCLRRRQGAPLLVPAYRVLYAVVNISRVSCNKFCLHSPVGDSNNQVYFSLIQHVVIFRRHLRR